MAGEKLAPSVYAFPEVAAPGTPPSGHTYVYVKSDGILYIKDDAGTETPFGGGLTSPVGIGDGGTGQTTQTAAFNALSPLVNKGDLIVRDNTNNVRLPVGSDGYALIASSADAEGIEWKKLAWVEIVPATELGSSQTTITFSSIPNVYQDLRLVIRPRSTSTGVNTLITFNADTGSSYSKNSSDIDSSGTESHTVSNNQTSIACLNTCVPSSGTSGYFGHLEMLITGYRESAYTRVGNYRGGRFTSATLIHRTEGTFGWENVANALSSIESNLNAGDFEAGTIYALYGLGTNA